jgi:hypothetical protein
MSAVTNTARTNTASSGMHAVSRAAATMEASSEIRRVTTNETSCATATMEPDGSRAREELFHAVAIRATSTTQ